MKKVIAYFIKFPVAVNVALLAIFIFGLGGLTRMNFSFFPLFPTTTITINFLHRACAGDLLRIETDVARRGQRAISFQHKIFNDCTGRLIADAQVTVVFLERATGKVVPIDERITELWPELLELPAE